MKLVTMENPAFSSGHPCFSRVREPDLLHPYTVCYLDGEFNPYHYCCYAFSEEKARASAIEMVQHIRDNPDSIKWIVKEDADFDW
jgi:hypothetical protein